MSALPTLLNTKQVAELLGVSVDALAQNRYLGEGIPYIKIGKRVRYNLDDVIAYLETQKVKTIAK